MVAVHRFGGNFLPSERKFLGRWYIKRSRNSSKDMERTKRDYVKPITKVITPSLRYILKKNIDD